MISEAQLKQWTEQARRDDWHMTFVGSDIRVMLGEIGRLQAALKPFAAAAEVAERDEADDYSLYGSSARHVLTIGDLRKAHAVIVAEKQTEVKS